MRYVDDSCLDIDLNRVERQIRAVAVGRRNWMFAGSAEGGTRAAILNSLIGTCGLLGVGPWAYLKDVLQRIDAGENPVTLTPPQWEAAHMPAAGRDLRGGNRRPPPDNLEVTHIAGWVYRALTLEIPASDLATLLVGLNLPEAKRRRW